MIPILFDSTEIGFTTNGIGRLVNATSCRVVEERNGLYELTMKYPVSGKYYDELKINRLILATPADGKAPQPFRIYNITKPINGIVTAKAEHISYQLSFIPVMPFDADSLYSTFVGFKQHAAEVCPFDFWTDKTGNAPYTQTYPASIRARLGGEEGGVLDLYGGEYEWDMYTVKLWQHRGTDKGVTLRYGKNITDIEQEESIDGVYTGIVPYWSGRNSEDEDVVVILPEFVLHAPTADNYPFKRTIPVDLSDKFDDPPSEADLRAAGRKYIEDNNIGIPKVSLSISFVSLWQTEEYKEIASLERVNLCDTVHVIFEKLGIEATAKVISTDYDVLLERYNVIKLGDAKSSFVGSVAAVDDKIKEQEKEAESWFAKEIARATAIISGALGGHVVFNRNADGGINEILVMDTEDKATAHYVMRINLGGIGFSQKGYEGPFNSAWLLDGTFDASKINVVNLNAGSVVTGVLTDKQNKNYWNLDTGVMKIVASEFSLTSGETLASTLQAAKDYADDAAEDAVDAQTQADIFNKLTGGGTNQGIYLTNGSLYLNASYIGTGTLAADRIGAGTITSTKLSNDVNNSITGAASEEQLIYISKASGTTSVAANTTWVTNTTGNQNVWTTRRPQYNSSYPVLFIAKQKKTVGGTVGCTTPVIDQTTTVIDGGHITTGTIDASKVTVTNLSASNITTGTMSANRISGGSIDATNVDVKNLNASKITSGILKDSGGNFSFELSTGKVAAKKFSISSNNFWLKEGGELTSFDNSHQTFARIDGSKVYVGHVSRSWDSGSHDNDEYNDNYIISGGINGSRTDGKLNVSTEINSWWLHFNVDGMSVRDARNSGVYYEGGSGTVNVGGMTLTFKNGLMVTALS